MWKRLKTPWTVVIVLVLAFAGVLGRGYRRSRARDALVAELRERGADISWVSHRPPWLGRLLFGRTHLFQRRLLYNIDSGDEELEARICEYLPRALIVTEPEWCQRAQGPLPAAAAGDAPRRDGSE